MKILLIILSTMLLVPEAYAIECTLPLCKKFQEREASFKKYFKVGKSKRYNKIRKVSFNRFKPSKPKPNIRTKKSNKLLWPLKRGRISSNFGYRKNPFNGKHQHHNGLDIAAPIGRLIRASADGVVTRSGRMSNGCGIGVYINHGNYETIYCHASKVLVKIGDRVKRGQNIGRVGSTGYSTGPHLHFEVRKNKKSYNPLKFLG
jgi:murein DD-endopeptidase MepM/ murein hydrolase activator NlpD